VKFSVADLKFFAEQQHSLFFNPKELEASGDTLENFHVRTHPISIIANCDSMRLCWELYRMIPNKLGKLGSFYFNVETYEQHFKREIV
jgi:hypothetical protein